MTSSNVIRLTLPAPRPEELAETIRMLVKQGKYAFSMSSDDEKIVGGDLDIVQGVEVLETGEIDGPITPGDNAGEWKCRLVTSLELRSSYVAAETLVVRRERLIVLIAKWIE
jgi:hypothetical protein